MKYTIILLLISSTLYASGDFSLSIQRSTESEWMRLVPKGKVWECGTKQSLPAETAGDPLENLDWAGLEKEALNKPKDCKEIMKVNNNLKGEGKTVVTCLSQPISKALYNRVSGNCKSGI